VEDQLGDVGVMDVKSSGLEGSVDKFSGESSLNFCEWEDCHE
jgi:hypothetical protein